MVRVVAMVSMALLLLLVVRSLSWVLIGDAPLYHYVAWLLTEGLVPYRDIFEFNMPGVYLVHLAVISTLGDGDLAWRLFDLACLGGIMVLLYRFVRPFGGRWGALIPALLFGLTHLAGGPWLAGQRDFLLCLLLLAGAFGAIRFWERGGAYAPLVWSGLPLGLAMVIKPFTGLFWLLCLAVVLAASRRLRPGRPGATVLIAASGLVLPALVGLWLFAVGGLLPFLRLLREYIFPFYGKMGAGPVAAWKHVGLHLFGWQIFAFVAFLGILGLTVRVPRELALRRWMALAGVAYGALHFTLQRKGFPYHSYPLVCFALALAGPALASGRERLRDDLGLLGQLAAPFRQGVLSPGQVACLVAAATAALLGVRGVMAPYAPEIATYAARVDAIEARLGERVPAGERVQVMDDTWANGVHALLRLRLHQPAPFIYDFPLFHDPSAPAIARLRERFTADLLAAPPAALVLSRVTANRTTYERIEELPEVAAMLATDYALDLQGDDFRIYLRRDLTEGRGEGAPDRGPATGDAEAEGEASAPADAPSSLDS